MRGKALQILPISTLCCLILIQLFACTLKAQDTGRPKILIIPPVTEVDRKVAESFQWDLAKVLDKSGTFDIVSKKHYTNYLKGLKLDRARTIPDSIIPMMMDSLHVSIYSKGVLTQEGGKGTELKACIDFIFPENDYSIQCDEHGVSDEKKTGELAKKVAEKIILESEKISYMSIAQDYYKSSIYYKALEYYKKYLALEPCSVNAQYRVGTCYSQMDSIDQAIATYKNILANYDPEHFPTHDKLAKLYFSREDFENALVHYKFLAAKKPEEYGYTRYEAYCLDKLDRPAEAYEAFSRLVEIQDDDPNIRNKMGYIKFIRATELEQAGDSAAARTQAAEAVKHFQRLAELCKCTNADTVLTGRENMLCSGLNFTALSLLKAGQDKKAIEAFKKLVAVDPEYSNAYYYLAIKSNQLKQTDDALKYAAQALKYVSDSQKYSLYSIMGRIYRQRKDYSHAVDIYTKALPLAPARRKIIVLLFRGLSYYDLAGALDYSNDEDADIEALIEEGKITINIANKAIALYDKAEANLRKITNGRYSKSAKAHIGNIAQLKARLNKIKQQIDYFEKTK